MDTVYVVFGLDWDGFGLGKEDLKVFSDRVEAYEYYKAEVEPKYMYAFIQTRKVEKKKPRSRPWKQKNT